MKGNHPVGNKNIRYRRQYPPSFMIIGFGMIFISFVIAISIVVWDLYTILLVSVPLLLGIYLVYDEYLRIKKKE
jgi:hypothetical protein